MKTLYESLLDDVQDLSNAADEEVLRISFLDWLPISDSMKNIQSRKSKYLIIK